jgi:ketosteroid isomerase-like protein
MSQENVETVRRGLDAINRGDIDYVERVAHPDYEFENAPGVPGGGHYRGRDAVKAFGRDFFETWESYTIEADQILDAGETVVVLGRVHAVGKGSGATVDSPVAYVHTLRDGKLTHTRSFLSHDEALEAAGLRE